MNVLLYIGIVVFCVAVIVFIKKILVKSKPRVKKSRNRCPYCNFKMDFIDDKHGMTFYECSNSECGYIPC